MEMTKKCFGARKQPQTKGTTYVTHPKLVANLANLWISC